MRNLIVLLLILCVTVAWGQTAATPPPVTVVVQLGPVEQLWKFFFGIQIVLAFFCTQPADATAPVPVSTVLMPGDSSTCTVLLSQPASIFGVNVTINIPAPLVGSPEVSGGILKIPAGSVSATFTVTYPASAPATSTPAVAPAVAPAAMLPIFPAGYSVWVGDNAGNAQHFVDIMIPCCAQTDLCGLPADQVAMEACND
jgi:hypothetical protein